MKGRWGEPHGCCRGAAAVGGGCRRFHRPPPPSGWIWEGGEPLPPPPPSPSPFGRIWERGEGSHAWGGCRHPRVSPSSDLATPATELPTTAERRRLPSLARPLRWIGELKKRGGDLEKIWSLPRLFICHANFCRQTTISSHGCHFLMWSFSFKMPIHLEKKVWKKWFF